MPRTPKRPEPKLIIRDNGSGMSERYIEKALRWISQYGNRRFFEIPKDITILAKRSK